MKKTYIVSADGYKYSHGSKNIFDSLELATQALRKMRLQISANSWGRSIGEIKTNENTKLPEFSFMTGGWDSVSVCWKILDIDICESIKDTNMFYDAEEAKRKQALKDKEADDAKKQFVAGLDPSLVKEFEKHFQIKINK
jgi:hypothetical protein